MGTFSRLRYVIAANVNAMLEKAENPHKLIRALIREMEEAREEARVAVAELMAEESHLERSLQQAEANQRKWQERAELAVKQSRDDLAREALKQKTETEELQSNLNAELSAARERVAQVRQDMATLNSKLQQAKQIETELSRKPATHSVNGKTVAIPESKTDKKLRRVFSRFDTLESQVESLEARVRSYETVEPTRDPWTALRSVDDEAVEAELSALKKRLDKPAKAGGSAEAVQGA